MANGTLFTDGSVAGLTQAFLKLYNNTFTLMLKSQRSLLIAQSCAQMLLLRGHRKKEGQEAQALGRSCGGFSTKINLSLSEANIPLRITLTPGQRHDVTQASALLEGIECQCLIADRGYDSDAFIEELTSKDIEVVIPPRKSRTEPRDYDKEKYKSP